MENDSSQSIQALITPKSASKPIRKRKEMKNKTVKKAIKKVKKTGRRYSAEEKQRVIDFVKNNAGRGVMSKAMKEFGISYISLRSWLKKEGSQVEKAFKSVVKAVKGKRGRPKGSVSKKIGVVKGGRDEFDSLVKLIQVKRAELKELMSRLSKVAV